MNLINFLKNNENARKIFGKGELKIIEKQMLGIALTQSEKNRLSRDIRKKFEFIKEISKYNYDLRLKKGSEIKEIIKEALEIIKESSYINKIKKIYLFGSTVEKANIYRSDIDMAVEFKEINEIEAGKFRLYILGRVNKKIDIQVYNTLPDKIKREIDSKGRILWKKE